MAQTPQLPFFVSVPHSGEQVPDEASWLKGLPETKLMRDVDRFVDKLYGPAIEKLSLSSIITSWHRYVVDLNRKTDQFDASAVLGAPIGAGIEPKGLHWSRTTFDEVLIPEPMSMELHQILVDKYYRPFHEEVKKRRSQCKKDWGVCYHMDLHSMPSRGTEFHPDPGEDRAQVVISDFHGQSCEDRFKELVMKSYQQSGFQVAYNWPYVGGGITQMYGDPKNNFHTIQIELNRDLYMDEETKKLKGDNLAGLQKQLAQAVSMIKAGVKDWLDG